jgi:hypothetical protein
MSETIREHHAEIRILMRPDPLPVTQGPRMPPFGGVDLVLWAISNQHSFHIILGLDRFG